MSESTEYVCVHRPQCTHYPHTSIPKGEEEWVITHDGGRQKESHHRDCVSGLHYVARDGERVSPYCIAEDGAFAWLLRNQGQSVDYATQYGGYSFEVAE